MQMHFNEIANIFKCLYLLRRAHTHTLPVLLFISSMRVSAHSFDLFLYISRSYC